MSQDGSHRLQELLSAALQLHQAGRLQEAERLYRQIIQADPRHSDALHFLGVVAHQAGRNDEAVVLIGRAIAQNSRVPGFHNNLGNAFKAQGKWQEAAASYQRALSQKPDYAAAHYNLGVVQQAQQELDAAAASYSRAIAQQPGNVEAHGNLGNVLQAQGKLEEAVACYRRALSHKPDYVEALCNLGNVLKAQGKFDESAAAYGHALRLQPNYAQAHNNLGILFLEQGRLDDAVASYRKALAAAPRYIEAHHNLGNALKEQGRPAEAQASFERALAIEPNHAQARMGLAIAAIPIFARSLEESLDVFEKFTRSLDGLTAWSDAHPGKLGQAVGSNQPFYLAYRPADVGGLLSRYGDLVSATAAAHWRPPAPSGPTVQSPDRIRVVVVSGQVRQHPVWEVILRGLLAHIDRRRFEIDLYHTGSIVDDETAWAKANVDRFVQGPKSMKAWLAEIDRDRPHVLFYPEVGMDPAACALATLRLAPLQVASWGHPVTTGLPSMDCFLSGELLEGEQADRHYRERLVRLPGTGATTTFAAVDTQRWEGPARQPNTVRFALCQQPIKFDPADDVLLTRIAAACAPCEFWLASPRKLEWAAARLRERLAAAFRAEGLDPDAFLRVTPWLPRAQFDGFLDEMDIYLDCPAFSGYTTAWQALHRGLPIVTLEGEFLRQRLAAGLLRQIGMTAGIVSTRDGYVDIAEQWASQSRDAGPWCERRVALRRAALTANDPRAVVSAFEHTLSEALQFGRDAAPPLA